MMILSYYFAIKKKYPIEEQFQLRKLWITFKEAAWAFSLPVIIIGGILGGVFTATEAASMAVMAAFFIGVFVYRELRFRDLPQVLLNCGIQSAVVMMIVAGSALLSWFLTNELIPQRIAFPLCRDVFTQRRRHHHDRPHRNAIGPEGGH
jgi:TRAP-type C4-dicarboxylate transport system permease large subunit